MQRCRTAAWLVAVLVSMFESAGALAQSGTPCERITAMTMPQIQVVSAGIVARGAFAPVMSMTPLDVPAFCRVVATATPSSESNIQFEVWIPVESWNGKLLGVANGGFGGAINYPALAASIGRGYAAVGTDTGHSGDQMEFGRGSRERVIDWAYRSVHVMTDAAKLIVRNHRGRFPQRSYFNGCSTGGHQALSEAQRFPEDYDGIVAGAPGNNRKRLIYGFLWSWLALHDEGGKPLLTAENLSLIGKSVLAQCDRDDRLEDGLVGDPRHCAFDPAQLACRKPGEKSCLSNEQITAVRKVYAGARNPRTGELIFTGWPRGTEEGWRQYLLDPPEPMRIGLFRDFGFHDPHWHWRSFDWDRDVAYLDAQLPWLDATSTDLGAFRARGGKLLMYAGWADAVVPASDTVAYYERVSAAMGAGGGDFMRLFLAPGMGHCAGGPGPDSFDALAALEQWVERGTAPGQLIATKRSGDRVVRSRPLCPYPQMARYKGEGSVDEAASFDCVTSAADGTTVLGAESPQR